MAVRTGHGTGSGVPRVEVLPPDELPAGVPGDGGAPAEGDHDARGRFAAGNKASAVGGRARAGTTRLARRMGLAGVNTDPAFAPYKRAAADFRRAQVTALARTVGGGHCGPAPSSIIASAAWQLAVSRFLFDTAGSDVEKLTVASRLANDSRQNLLAAHELCAREAAARPRGRGRALAALLDDGDEGASAPRQRPANAGSDREPTEGFGDEQGAPGGQ